MQSSIVGMGAKGGSLLRIKCRDPRAAMLLSKMHMVLVCKFSFLTVTQASVHYTLQSALRDWT